jgi:hypothetical protein
VEVTGGAWPLNVAADGKMVLNASGLWVAQPNLSRVILINSTTGATLKTIGGTLGSGSGQLKQPYGFSVDSTGNITVADTGNHRIQVFATDNTPLDAFGTFGYYGTSEFNALKGIAHFSTGRVVVADTENWRVLYLDQVLCFGACTSP